MVRLQPPSFTLLMKHLKRHLNPNGNLTIDSSCFTVLDVELTWIHIVEREQVERSKKQKHIYIISYNTPISTDLGNWSAINYAINSAILCRLHGCITNLMDYSFPFPMVSTSKLLLLFAASRAFKRDDATSNKDRTHPNSNLMDCFHQNITSKHSMFAGHHLSWRWTSQK